MTCILIQILQIISNVHTLEAVGRVSETQFQLCKKLNSIIRPVKKGNWRLYILNSYLFVPVDRTLLLTLKCAKLAFLLRLYRKYDCMANQNVEPIKCVLIANTNTNRDIQILLPDIRIIQLFTGDVTICSGALK